MSDPKRSHSPQGKRKKRTPPLGQQKPTKHQKRSSESLYYPEGTPNAKRLREIYEHVKQVRAELQQGNIAKPKAEIQRLENDEKDVPPNLRRVWARLLNPIFQDLDKAVAQQTVAKRSKKAQNQVTLAEINQVLPPLEVKAPAKPTDAQILAARDLFNRGSQGAFFAEGAEEAYVHLGDLLDLWTPVLDLHEAITNLNDHAPLAQDAAVIADHLEIALERPEGLPDRPDTLQAEIAWLRSRLLPTYRALLAAADSGQDKAQLLVFYENLEDAIQPWANSLPEDSAEYQEIMELDKRAGQILLAKNEVAANVTLGLTALIQAMEKEDWTDQDFQRFDATNQQLRATFETIREPLDPEVLQGIVNKVKRVDQLFANQKIKSYGRRLKTLQNEHAQGRPSDQILAELQSLEQDIGSISDQERRDALLLRLNAFKSTVLVPAMGPVTGPALQDEQAILKSLDQLQTRITAFGKRPSEQEFKAIEDEFERLAERAERIGKPARVNNRGYELLMEFQDLVGRWRRGEQDPVAQSLSDAMAEDQISELQLERLTDSVNRLQQVVDTILEDREPLTQEEYEYNHQLVQNALRDIQTQLPAFDSVTQQVINHRVKGLVKEANTSLESRRVRPPREPPAKTKAPAPAARVEPKRRDITVEHLKTLSVDRVQTAVAALAVAMKEAIKRGDERELIEARYSNQIQALRAWFDAEQDKLPAHDARRLKTQVEKFEQRLARLRGQARPKGLSNEAKLEALRDAIDAIPLDEWPSRYDTSTADFYAQIERNFNLIQDNVPFFKEAVERQAQIREANKAGTMERRCDLGATRELDLHQLFGAAWLYCPSSTGELAFWSTGAGKTAGAWAALRMYKSKKRSRYGPVVDYGKTSSAKLLWVTKPELVSEVWKDAWAYSDKMDPGLPAAERAKEQALIEKEVQFITYKKYENWFRGYWASVDPSDRPDNLDPKQLQPYNIWRDDRFDRYGSEAIDLSNARVIIDETQNLLEKTGPYTVDIKLIEDPLFGAYDSLRLELQDGEIDREQYVVLQPKLMILSATPFFTEITSLPRLLNLLIDDSGSHLPTNLAALKHRFFQPDGQWKKDGESDWNEATKGLVVCYDGRSDRSLFAQPEIEPMKLAPGNVLQANKLAETGDTRKRLQILDWAGQVEAGNSKIKIPPRLNAMTRAFDPRRATEDYFQKQNPEPLSAKAKVMFAKKNPFA